MTWQLKKTGFMPEGLALEESLFSLGNGYLGVRGCLEEFAQSPGTIRGSYINGLYARVPMQHAENAAGFPQQQDKQPRIADTQTSQLWLDGEALELAPERLRDYERSLNFEQGQTTRTYTYLCKSGKEAKLKFERIASLVYPECFCYRISVDYPGQIHLVTHLDGDVENYVNPKDPRVGSGHSKLLKCLAISATQQEGNLLMEVASTGIRQAVAVAVNARTYQVPVPFEVACLGDKIIWQTTTRGDLQFEKRCAYSDSLRTEACLDRAINMLNHSAFDYLSAIQEDYLKSYWEAYGIEIHGCHQDQVAIRFMQFQLLQALGRDAYSNMAAKGLSGEGYEGHYFWDTEIYGIPAAMWSMPERSRALLSYRHRLLPMAKDRALELGHLRGAAFPWRTISGIESSGYFPAGTAQYHINADIAYAGIQYHLAHEDWEFTRDVLFELIFETALIWLEIGHRHGDSFRICAVTGPDEYTAIVNNNYYTNSMAKYHLDAVGWLYEALVARYGAAFESQWHLRLTPEVQTEIRWACDHMYLPVDAARNMAKQDDTFLEKPPWPFDVEAFQKRPLLLHYHPLTIYRYQVLKQADAVLAHLLVEGDASETFMANTFNYYEPLTTHDSSLSACIYGMMAARLNDPVKAYAYFQESLALDLEDTHGNTKDGLHLANIAGSVLSIYKGFGGMRLEGDGLHLRPKLPLAWRGYGYGVTYLGGHLRFSIRRHDQGMTTTLTYKHDKGQGVTLWLHLGDQIHQVALAPDLPATLVQPQVNQGVEVSGKTYLGVAFDMDGVLTETSHWHYVAWRDLAEKLGFDLPSAYEDHLRGVSRMAALEMVLNHGGLGDAIDDETRLAYAEWKNQRYLSYIKAFTAKDRMPGVEMLLMGLKAKGLKIALASASANAPMLLRAMGLEGYFDVIVDPSEIENPKPAPDIFLEACRLMALEPGACLGIEDATAGIESILAAGLYAIGIGNKSLLSRAHETYPDLVALYQAIKIKI